MTHNDLTYTWTIDSAPALASLAALREQLADLHRRADDLEAQLATAEREAARRALRAGDAGPAMRFNRRMRLEGDTCGGCIGAGTGGNCCICGKPRA